MKCIYSFTLFSLSDIYSINSVYCMRYVGITAYVTFLSAIDKEISYSDLKSLLEKGSVFLVDVRTKAEVDNGRIPGSIHIPGEGGDAQT